MKFNKSVYLLLFAACLSGLASCSDDDDFTWSEPVPSDCMDVYFADSNPTTYDVMSDEIDNLSFTVEVMRLNSAEAATVPLTVFSRSEAFECPSTIEFAAGENKAPLEVKVNKVSSGDYTLELSIGDVRYSNPYVTYDGGWSVLSIDMTVWDFLGTGTFYYNGLFSGEDPGLSLYASGTSYKITNWGDGVDLLFKCDATGKITVAEQYVGADHQTYGPVYVTTDGADVTSYYDPETQTYYFNMAYNVSAGTFGTMYEKFVLTDPVQ